MGYGRFEVGSCIYCGCNASAQNARFLFLLLQKQVQGASVSHFIAQRFEVGGRQAQFDRFSFSSPFLVRFPNCGNDMPPCRHPTAQKRNATCAVDYIHTHTHTHIYIYIRVYDGVHMRALCSYAIYVYMYMYIYIYIYMCVCDIDICVCVCRDI